MGLLNITQQAYYDGNDFGNYQFTSLDDIINQFMVAYVGEDKIISKIKRVDVAFHAQRALQELSFDTFKSCKAQEITVPATLQMMLPQDYVNYTKVSWVDSAGIKHLMYPTSKTSNPTPILQDSEGKYKISTEAQPPATPFTYFLHGLFPNIRIGTIVRGTELSSIALVETISHSATNTTITLVDGAGVGVDTVLPFGSYSGNIVLNFENPGGSIFLEPESTHVQQGCLFYVGVPEITFLASSIPSELKVGMEIIHHHFPQGTVIESLQKISATEVLILPSNSPTANSYTTTPAYNTNITFVSTPGNSTTWNNYKSATPSENQDDYQDDTYWPLDGSRYGLDPQHAQANGSFYIDCQSGKIHFSSNISGKTVILDYISDSLGTDGEMQVHKFAEEAMYKWIAYAILSTRANTQEYIVRRFKKERFAAIRSAKLRLSNIKLEEITQVLRGKSKQIKH